MHRFWSLVLEPMVEAVEAKLVLEIGTERGRLTERALAWAEPRGAAVHTIDPVPQIPVDEWRQRWGDSFVFHEALSLNVLPRLQGVDAAFIDGDHNWYTVVNELRLLERGALEAKRVPPVIALHDVAWPYARRDLYYDPGKIPVGHRLPYRRAGMLPDRGELVDSGGMNAHLDNAIYEHNVENGVLTAVEDFLAGSKLEWRWWLLPGVAGLGVLLPEEAIEERPAVRELADRLSTPEFLSDVIALTERSRIESEMVRAQHGRARSALEKAKRELDERVAALQAEA